MKSIPKIGFISAPAWFDPAPAEFPTVIEEHVQTQQAPLPFPKFNYELNSIASVQHALNQCAQILKSADCSLVAQVGSPFAWALVTTEAQARSRNMAITDSAGIPSIMTGLAIIDGARALGVKRVAVTCTYYEATWRDQFENFLYLCDLHPLHVSNLVDQNLANPSSKMKDYGWSMTPELTRASILAAKSASPDAEAIIVTGAGTRTLRLLTEFDIPIIAADTILYWAIARTLNLTLKPEMGFLARL